MKQWVRIGEDAPFDDIPLSIPKGLWQYLYTKGIKASDDIEGLFSPSLNNLTHPFALDQMDLAVDRLIEAYVKKESVAIYADFDMDGTPGLALLKLGLELCGFEDIKYVQPKRISQGYGVHDYLLKDLVDQGVQLLVTVDVGITDVEAIQYAKEIGLDVIVTDHHLAKETLPPAVAIVNPNKNEDQSGLGHLCGAGVAFYLVLALKNQMKEKGLLQNAFSAKVLLDCFTIGTLTDMVPLVKENRVLVKHGLKAIENTQRPGLRALLHILGLSGKELSGSDVAIRLAPKLNALSRLETDILPIDIFLETDEEKAKELVKNVMKKNDERIKLQTKAEKEAVQQFSESSQENFVWVASRNFHKGVVGLVATKLSQNFNIPAFVGSINEEGKVTGSSRLPKGYEGSLLDALEFSQEALVKFGGHAPAAGFELKEQDVQAFEDKLFNFYKDIPEETACAVYLEYHSEAQISEIDHRFMRWMDQLGPFGEQFESPLFRLNRLQLKSIKSLKGGHLKFSFSHEKRSQKIDALWFSPPKGHPVNHTEHSEGDLFDVLGEPQWNYFNGRQSIQLLIKDIKVS